MPAENFMGTTDNEKRLWLIQFSSGVSADPGKFLCSTADAATIAAAVDAYDAAYAVANNDVTRTIETVATKDSLRNSAEGVCRQYAGMIKRNAGVSDEDKIAIGVPPMNSNREPRMCPQSGITLSVTAATQGTHTLNFINTLEPTSKAKAFGADGVELFLAIAPAAAGSVDAAKYYRKFTRNPMVVTFTPADNGKIATYFARWVGRRGDTGPFSPGVSMAIAA